jgi:hypothetical protein
VLLRSSPLRARPTAAIQARAGRAIRVIPSAQALDAPGTSCLGPQVRCGRRPVTRPKVHGPRRRDTLRKDIRARANRTVVPDRTANRVSELRLRRVTVDEATASLPIGRIRLRPRAGTLLDPVAVILPNRTVGTRRDPAADIRPRRITRQRPLLAARTAVEAVEEDVLTAAEAAGTQVAVGVVTDTDDN